MSAAKRLYYAAPQVRSRIVECRVGSEGQARSCTSRFVLPDGKTTFGLGIPQKRAFSSGLLGGKVIFSEPGGNLKGREGWGGQKHPGVALLNPDAKSRGAYFRGNPLL